MQKKSSISGLIPVERALIQHANGLFETDYKTIRPWGDKPTAAQLSTVSFLQGILPHIRRFPFQKMSNSQFSGMYKFDTDSFYEVLRGLAKEAKTPEEADYVYKTLGGIIK